MPKPAEARVKRANEKHSQKDTSIMIMLGSALDILFKKK